MAATVLTWTFVGRADELDLVRDVLVRQGRSAVLTGPAGVGKSSLALAVAERIADDLAVVRATSGLARTPVAALVPLLESLQIPDDRRSDPAELVAAALAALDRRATPLYLVIDDAPRLDPMSAEIAHQLMRHRSLRTVMTARDGEPLAEALDHLIDEGAAVRVEILPLDRQACADAACSALGRPLVGSAAVTLFGASGGNPLYLRELITGTAAAGGFRSVGDAVELARAVPSARLVDLIGSRFAQLGERELRVLEELALAQPLPLAAYTADPALRDAVVSLEAQGLVHCDRAEVRLSHPVYGEVLRAATPTLRRHDRQASAIVALRSSPDPESGFRATCLAVEAGLPVDRAELVAAARRAFGLLDHALALELARRAVDVGAGFDGHIVLGGAASALGDFQLAVDALDAASGDASDDAERAMAAQRLGMHLAVREQRPAAALDVAEAVLVTLEDPRWVRFLSADVAKWRLMAGRAVGELVGDATASAPHDESGPEQCVDRPDEVVTSLNRDMVYALVAVMDGHLAEADDAIDRALPLAIDHPELLPNSQDLLRLSQFLSRTFSAEVSAAAEFAESQLSEATVARPDAVGMWSFALGVTHLYCGRASNAVTSADVAIEQLAWRDFIGLGPSARALRAAALAQAGRRAEAERALDGLGPGDLEDPKVALMAAQAALWVAAGDRSVDAAAERLAQVARTGIELQHRCLAGLAAHEVVRLGLAEVVLDELELAASSGAGLMRLLADHAGASARRDVDGLREVSVRLESVGMIASAADCSARLAVLQHRRGRREAARAASLRANTLAERVDAVRGTAVDTAEDLSLTPRQREVVRLAASRLRGKEIAEQLGVSTRTVDNHLGSVYRKLGVSGREEMVSVLVEAGLLDHPDPR